ncbi:MAG: nitroreductase family deazaflavin-dependent oxidoreductase [Myxococcota bacterium]|nr:nitroreductase family deazaflavin-dependent oxidoreductase [Myxococcota bacterium]
MPQRRAPAPPTGWALRLARLPIALYRVGLGALLGRRFLLLTHRGRHSGEPRYAVLEVVRHDPETDTCIVAAGFGERSQWYRNLLADPRAALQLAGRRFDVEARVLAPDAAERELRDYGARHPRSLRGVARVCGWALDGTDADLAGFARAIRLVELRRVPR